MPFWKKDPRKGNKEKKGKIRGQIVTIPWRNNAK